MAERAPSLMSADNFLDWCEFQEGRYELVSGVAVAMAGAKRRHDQIVMNLFGEVLRHFGVGRCRPFSADLAVRIPSRGIRRPDVGVDCGQFDDAALAVSEPGLVVEVLSPGTRDFDLFGKVEEYKTVPTMCHIVLVDPDAPQAVHWSRIVGEAWDNEMLEGMDSALAFPDRDLRIAFVSIYAGLNFHARPQLL